MKVQDVRGAQQLSAALATDPSLDRPRTVSTAYANAQHSGLVLPVTHVLHSTTQRRAVDSALRVGSTSPTAPSAIQYSTAQVMRLVRTPTKTTTSVSARAVRNGWEHLAVLVHCSSMQMTTVPRVRSATSNIPNAVVARSPATVLTMLPPSVLTEPRAVALAVSAGLGSLVQCVQTSTMTRRTAGRARSAGPCTRHVTSAPQQPTVLGTLTQ